MSVRIHPTSLVEPGAELAEGVEIGPFCTIGPHVRLGAGVRLISHVTVTGATSLGAGTVAYPFCSLGTPPQDIRWDGTVTRLEVGERCIFREQVSIHAGSVKGGGVTRVGSECFFMVGSHVAHDCQVGDKVVLANTVQVGGHAIVGDQVWMGALAGIHQFCRIGRHAFVGAMAAVIEDVIPYGNVNGNHAHLVGLNVIGLRRRGFSREQIHALRSAYLQLFSQDNTFAERLEEVATGFADNPDVQEIIAFIRADASRALCMPG
jgi:UDP-N-acetylglucosamine acyltransferase